jgi:phage terminase large subunit-like protein
MRFIPEHIYELGNQPIDMEALKGRDCYGGLDLSSTGDITAFVLMFPPRDETEKYIMALDRCIRNQGQRGSVYDDPDHGLQVF